MRKTFSLFSLCLIWVTGFATADVYRVSDADANIKEIAARADSIPEVKPEFAADCRFAYTLFSILARDFYVDVRGDDQEAATSADMLADVWGLVLYRETMRTKRDPMKVKGHFIRTNSRIDLASKTRSTKGLFSRVEDQLGVCEDAERSERVE